METNLPNCPICGSDQAACPECGEATPMGTLAICPDCEAPMDCPGCGSTVAAELTGVLKPANDHT